MEGLHLHLRGAGREPVAPGADRQGAYRDLPAPVQRPAVRPGLEGHLDRRDHVVLSQPGQGPGPARGPPRLGQDPGRKPTASSRRERRVPEAGWTGSGTAGGSGLGVTSVTMSSAIPYSSGSAPATTPPVSLMCSTPGLMSLAWPTMVCTISAHSSRFPAIRVSSVPTQNR